MGDGTHSSNMEPKLAAKLKFDLFSSNSLCDQIRSKYLSIYWGKTSFVDLGLATLVPVGRWMATSDSYLESHIIPQESYELAHG